MSQQLKQAIDNDDAQSALVILNQHKHLLNQYCVYTLDFSFMLFNWPMLPICLTNYQLVCIWREELTNTNWIIQSFPGSKYSGREGEYIWAIPIE